MPIAIDVVYEQLDESTSAEILAFWAARKALTPEEAQERLPAVICVHRDASGAVDGVNSAVADVVAAVGGRTLWIYRSLGAEADRPNMIKAAYGALNERFAGTGPVGLCVLADEELRRGRPEPLWRDPQLVYAGYTPDGRQIRIAYFDDARIGPGLT